MPTMAFPPGNQPVNSADGRSAGFVDNDAACLHHPTHFADGHLNVGKGIAFDGKPPAAIKLPFAPVRLSDRDSLPPEELSWRGGGDGVPVP
jgi:hypothetical protein